MGSCLTPPAQVINQGIETRLAEDKRKTIRNAHRIMVVGPRGSGKSTVCQRLQNIYNGKLLETNDKYLNSIREECVATSLYLLNIVKDINSIKSLKSLYMNNPSDLSTVANAISNIWKKWNNFKKLLSSSYLYKNEFGINDNIQYFIDNIDRIMCADVDSKSESVLMDQDVINYHTKSTSICQSTITTNDVKFEMVDVPNTLQYKYKLSIFVAALSDYCETLKIDTIKTENAMQYCLNDFERIVNCKYLKRCEAILFLNKDDIFKKRLKSGMSLSMCFGNEWDGDDYPPYEYNNNIWSIILGWIKEIEIEIKCVIPNVIGNVIVRYARKSIEVEMMQEEHFNECYEYAIKYIGGRFQQKKPNHYVSGRLFIHVTTAIDKENMERVFWDCQNIMIRSSLRYGGLV